MPFPSAFRWEKCLKVTRKVGGFTSLAQAVVERKLPALGFPQQVAVLGHGVSAVDRSLPVAAAGSGRPEIARTVRIAWGAVCGFVLGLREKCDYFEKCYWFLTLARTHTEEGRGALCRAYTHTRMHVHKTRNEFIYTHTVIGLCVCGSV